MKKAVSILLILTGILSIVFGIVVFSFDTGSNGNYASFGADYYTYVNGNAQKAATNAHRIAEIVRAGFGFSLIVAGIVIALLSIRSLSDNKSNNDTSINTPKETHEPMKRAIPGEDLPEL